MSDTSQSLTLNQRVGGSRPPRRTGQSGFPNLGTLPGTHIADDAFSVNGESTVAPQGYAPGMDSDHV